MLSVNKRLCWIIKGGGSRHPQNGLRTCLMFPNGRYIISQLDFDMECCNKIM